MHKSSSGKGKLICRFALNTSFIPKETNVYEFTKTTVDPDAVQKDERISPQFKIKLYFKDVCSQCDPSLPLDHLCKRCTQLMTDELQTWKIIKNILDVSLKVFKHFRIIQNGRSRMGC